MSENQSKGNVFAIATMFALFFMIAFVTNFATPMGVIAKNQFQASNALSQLGNAANFIAYLFMGIPGGLILKRKGYKFTALAAIAVGFLGVGVQLISGYVSSFAVYVMHPVVIRAMNVSGCLPSGAFCIVAEYVLAVAVSLLLAVVLHRALPRVSSVVFGGR